MENDGEQSRERIGVSEVIQSLNERTRGCIVELFFDAPQPLKGSTGVAMRGVIGTVLARTAPKLLEQFFKPDSNGNIPSAMALRQLTMPSEAPVASARFFLTFFGEPKTIENELLPLLATGLPECPFGKSHIRQVVISKPRQPSLFASEAGVNDHFQAWVDIRTPVRLKRHGRIVDARHFTLPFLVSGLAERLNKLSRHFGMGMQTQVEPLLAAAALTLNQECHIQTWSQQRTSGLSGDSISLNGCVGTMTADFCPLELARLLYWGTYAAAGRHASAGSGVLDVQLLLMT